MTATIVMQVLVSEPHPRGEGERHPEWLSFNTHVCTVLTRICLPITISIHVFYVLCSSWLALAWATDLWPNADASQSEIWNLVSFSWAWYKLIILPSYRLQFKITRCTVAQLHTLNFCDEECSKFQWLHLSRWRISCMQLIHQTNFPAQMILSASDS